MSKLTKAKIAKIVVAFSMFVIALVILDFARMLLLHGWNDYPPEKVGQEFQRRLTIFARGLFGFYLPGVTVFVLGAVYLKSNKGLGQFAVPYIFAAPAVAVWTAIFGLALRNI